MFDLQIPASHRRPVLSADEERNLLTEYAQTKSVSLRNKIVEHNLGLVFDIARQEFRHASGDLPSEGVFGLISAVEKFDVSKGVKFSTYARWWVRAYFFEYTFRNQKMVRMSVSSKNKKLFYNLEKMSSQLKSEGVEPTAEAIAERLGVTADDVVMAQTVLKTEKSMDESVLSRFGDSDKRFGELIANEGLTPEEAFAEASDAARLAEAIDSFRTSLPSNTWRTVFNECLLEDRFLADVARDLNISRERVRQIRNQLITKFKSWLDAKGIER